MIWLKDLRGRKVICNGKCIGRIIQAQPCDELKMLDGIWIDRILLGIRFVSAEHICVLGSDAVIVDSTGERLRMKPSKLLIRAVSTSGMRLGAITDAAADKHTMAITALALTTGWRDSMLYSPRIVKAFYYNSCSSHAVISDDDFFRTEVEA